VTMQGARAQLELAVEGAWAAVGELVLIALEDQPSAGSLAAADDLAEQVSEIQGALAEVRTTLGTGRAVAPAELPDVLPDVLTGLDAAGHRYWQRIRSHRPTAQLRDATRRLGGHWPAWQRSVELSALRCEEPFALVDTALQVCCREICEHVRSAGVSAASLPFPPEPYRRTS